MPYEKMRPRDSLELLLLSALWGGSFLLMRIAAPVFGPVPLIELRVAIAAVALVPAFLIRKTGRLTSTQIKDIAVVGIVNSAVPFCLFAYASLYISAGLDALLNATSPLWAAVIGYFWLKTTLTVWKSLGLAIGVLGVVSLGLGNFAFDGQGFAILAGVAAGLSYGFAANYTRSKLSGVDPIAIATGSQASAAAVLAPLAIWSWPISGIGVTAWWSAVILAVACTAFAYVLYFRLIANVGPAKAITVTFLVPVFAILWGYAILSEHVTLQITLGGLVVLLGAALSTGMINPNEWPFARRKSHR